MNLESQVLAGVCVLYGLLQLTLGQQGRASVQCMTKVQTCSREFTLAMAMPFGSIAPIMGLCGKEIQILDCLDAIEPPEDSCKTMVDSTRASVTSVLVDSEICDKMDEVEQYKTCLSRPAIPAGCQINGVPNCDQMVKSVDCVAANAKKECGEPQSDVMRMVAKTMANAASKAMNLECPELESSSRVKDSVLVYVVFLALLSVVVGRLI